MLFARLLIAWLVIAAFGLSCSTKINTVNPRLTGSMPGKILWAWERPEDLRFLDADQFGVAFLAQTIYLEKESVRPERRRQPLEVPPGTYLIAVTRIETQRDSFRRPVFDAGMMAAVAELIRKTLELPDVKAVQVDFDAMASERNFYRSMINELKNQLPADTPLTMTSLASWCTGDAWFNDFPVDEAVPMVFVMGTDAEKVKMYLRNGDDWQEPLCRGSYGISIDEGRPDGTKTGRRMYYFKKTAWVASDLARLR
jgi:hypothetical protein